jgi:hypothetical protein
MFGNILFCATENFGYEMGRGVGEMMEDSRDNDSRALRAILGVLPLDEKKALLAALRRWQAEQAKLAPCAASCAALQAASSRTSARSLGQGLLRLVPSEAHSQARLDQ